jgi:hypothetical protein
MGNQKNHTELLSAPNTEGPSFAAASMAPRGLAQTTRQTCGTGRLCRAGNKKGARRRPVWLGVSVGLGRDDEAKLDAFALGFGALRREANHNVAVVEVTKVREIAIDDCVAHEGGWEGAGEHDGDITARR